MNGWCQAIDCSSGNSSGVVKFKYIWACNFSRVSSMGACVLVAQSMYVVPVAFTCEVGNLIGGKVSNCMSV